MTPDVDDLWLLPLGGCGEIGMNMNLYGHDGRWLMVDCGITFARPGETAPHVQMPDPDFIEQRRESLVGLLITHAHEDHVGAVAHLWSRLRCPIYATAFAAVLARRKLAELNLLEKAEVIVIEPGSEQQLAGFSVRWLNITHSTPQSQALLIRTSAGAVFHTGDWKLDPQPVVGPSASAQDLAAQLDVPVVAMVCDSTNAMESGRSTSEGELYEGLLDVVSAANGRVVVGCFGSNVARLITLARVARASGRYPGLYGRSLIQYHAAAKACGLLDPADTLVDGRHLGYLPPEEVLAVATGSQGEPRAALHRLSLGNHPDMELARGDTVILSSRTIPGNEEAVAVLCDRFDRMGVEVIRSEACNRPIHASGHPARDELADLYSAVSPSIAIPVHGEDEHMAANADVARRNGVPRQMLGHNGDLFMLAPVPGVRRQVVATGRLGLDRGQLVAVNAD